MGFSYYDYKKRRYWMGTGNVRTCQAMEGDEKALEQFLQRVAVSVTTLEENIFVHPDEQRFLAEQRPTTPEGVPPSEAPPGVVPIGDEPNPLVQATGK